MIGVVLTVITSLGASFGFITAALGLVMRKKTNEIHVLVNSRLDQAIAEISDLKQQRDIKHAQDAIDQEGN